MEKKEIAAHLARTVQSAIFGAEKAVEKCLADAKSAGCLDEYKRALKDLGLWDTAKSLYPPNR